MRLAHITASSSNPSYFTVVVRAIPWSAEESYSDSVRKFFTKYHASSYLSHQMVYRSGKIQKLMVCMWLELFILFPSNLIVLKVLKIFKLHNSQLLYYWLILS